MATTTVETLKIQVDLDAANAEQGLDRLATKIGSMKGFNSIFKTSFGGFDKYARSSTVSAKGFANSIGGLVAKVYLLSRAFRGLSSMMEVASDLTETQNVVRTVFGEYESQIDGLSKQALESIGMSELAYKKVSSVYMAMGSTLGISKKEMAEMSVQMTNLSGDMASFFNRDYTETSQALQSIFTGMARPLMLAA